MALRSSSTPRKIILDTDPGGDDIFALLWLQSLVQQGFAQLVAVTTAEGNVSAARTFVSASQVLSLGKLHQTNLGRGVIPASLPTEDASHIHGADGMGNLSHHLPSPIHDYASAPFSDDIIIEQLQAEPNAITVIAIGPLTNLAAAETKVPGILQQAQEIVLMGGAFQCRGNITSHAEFNIWFNPGAAATVLNSGANITVLPMDVTTQLIFTQAMAEGATRGNPETPLAIFLQQLCAFMISTTLAYRETDGVQGFLVHDAVTLASLFYPETLLFRRACVQVETQGVLTRGQTLIDQRHHPKMRQNAWVALQVDAIALLNCLVEDLDALNQLIV
ncbi:MAG: nucleoside hydrolase [Symploca sp. SIO2B6]|nr:nucleoside hydrolase [Symploca sp. SIO2B6]